MNINLYLWKLCKRLDYYLGRVINISAYIAVGLLVFIVAGITWEIIYRMVTGKSVVWVVEFSEYSLLYITFLAAAWVLKKDEHIKMDMVINRFSVYMQSLINAITSTLAFLFVLIIFLYSLKTAFNYFQMSYYTPTPLQVPQWTILIVIPIGSLLILLQLLKRYSESIKIIKIERAKRKG